MRRSLALPSPAHQVVGAGTRGLDIWVGTCKHVIERPGGGGVTA